MACTVAEDRHVLGGGIGRRRGGVQANLAAVDDAPRENAA